MLLISVLKLLKMATGMRALLDTVVQALPQVSPQNSSLPMGIQVPLEPGDISVFWWPPEATRGGSQLSPGLGAEFCTAHPGVGLMGEPKRWEKSSQRANSCRQSSSKAQFHWEVWETPAGTGKDVGGSTGSFQLRSEAGMTTIIDRGAAALERQIGEMLLRVKILIWGHQ